MTARIHMYVSVIWEPDMEPDTFSHAHLSFAAADTSRLPPGLT